MRIAEWFTRLFARKESATAKAVFVGGGGTAWSEQDLEKVAREGFEGNAVANACISGIADAVAGVDWFVEAPDGSEIPNAEKSPLMTLWNRPNPTMSRSTFLRAVSTYFFAEGNAYIERTEGKVELWPLRPDRTTIHYDGRQDKIVTWYEYKVGAAAPTKFTAEQILHLKVFSPVDDFYGKSPLYVAAPAIDTDNEAMLWNRNLLKNGARPSGILQVEGILPDDQRERLKQMIQENWSGRNSISPKLLENGLKWTATGLSPADMDFTTGLKVLARRICMVLNYPPELVGDSENKTYSNYMEARKALYQDVVCPFLDYLRDEFNTWLAPLFGENVKLQYDKDDIEALQENRAQMFDRVAAADWMTLNEQREATGFPRIEDPEYDKPRASTTPALPVGFGMEPEAGAQGDDDGKEGEEETATPALAKPPLAQGEDEEKPPKHVGYWSIKCREEKEVAFRQIEKERAVFAAQISKALKLYFRQERNLIKRIMLRHDGDLQAAKKEVLELIDKRRPTLISIYRKFFFTAARWFFNRVRVGLKSADAPTERKAMADWLQRMRVFYGAEIPIKARLVTETTQRQLEEIFKEGFETDASTSDIVDQLMAVYDEHYVKNRADTIADSEIVGISNYGSIMGAQATEKPLLKHWMSERDDKVRDSHVEADEHYVPGILMEAPFYVGKDEKYAFMFPGDRSGNPPLEELINCRCWVTYSEAT